MSQNTSEPEVLFANEVVESTVKDDKLPVAKDIRLGPLITDERGTTYAKLYSGSKPIVVAAPITRPKFNPNPELETVARDTDSSFVDMSKLDSTAAAFLFQALQHYSPFAPPKEEEEEDELPPLEDIPLESAKPRKMTASDLGLPSKEQKRRNRRYKK